MDAIDAAKAVCAVIIVLAWGGALILTLLYTHEFFLPVLTGSGFPMWALERLLASSDLKQLTRELKDLEAMIVE
ncbi:MAG: hypothetical protein ACUVTM_06370 [Candidatus Bathyarchaeia archaeon]